MPRWLPPGVRPPPMAVGIQYAKLLIYRQTNKKLKAKVAKFAVF